ncbi:MAG: 50S ribosomal protein L22 [Parcubacteria group bacterium]
MKEAKAHLKSYRQSPRKVRVVADAVRGKSVEEAITVLSFMPKRASLPLQKLLASALANAKNLSLTSDNLVVKEIMVDAGTTLYRRRPRSRGMANPIRKRTSHVSVTLAESTKKPKKVKAKKVAETTN